MLNQHLKVVATLILLALSGCTKSTRTSESLAKSDLIVTDIQNAPIEYQLAYLDTGQLPRGNDLKAARIRFLLSAISEKTGDSKEIIADRTSRCTQIARQDYGREVKNVDFLEKANETVANGPKTTYKDASAVTLMSYK